MRAGATGRRSPVATLSSYSCPSSADIVRPCGVSGAGIRVRTRAFEARDQRIMCGIIGIIGKAEVAPLLLDGLKRLEYRGYDSAGVATLVNGHIARRRAEGKLANLEALLDREPLPGTVGIGHTR